MRKRSFLMIGGLALLVLLAAGLILYSQWFGFGGIQSGDALAPTLESNVSNQLVYRIDSSQSFVRYEVTERFTGRDLSTAVGISRQIGGDILIDKLDPSLSQIGTIVINVEQFESDSGLRDRRIRREFLESERYPEAIFVTSEILDMPAELQEGTVYHFEIIGDLSVKTTSQSVSWAATARLDDDRLFASASTTILMSDFGIGPINIAGLVETSDEVRLTFEFVALNAESLSPEATEASSTNP